MIEVFPVRTPTIPPATHTNCHLIGGVVIDPASPDADEQERLFRWLDGRCTRILLTHHHADHIGGVADLAARTGAPVLAHRDARLPFPVQQRLDDDDVIEAEGARLRCLHTPGHADGHLCFELEGRGEVIVGDMLAGIGTIVLAGSEGDLGTYLQSLERLEALGGVFYPAHGPALADGAAIAAAYRVHRLRRNEQLREALAERAASTLFDLVETVYAGIPGVDPMMAAAQLYTHLRWMSERGEVLEGEQGWQIV